MGKYRNANISELIRYCYLLEKIFTKMESRLFVAFWIYSIDKMLYLIGFTDETSKGQSQIDRVINNPDK